MSCLHWALVALLTLCVVSTAAQDYYRYSRYQRLQDTGDNTGPDQHQAASSHTVDYEQIRRLVRAELDGFRLEGQSRDHSGHLTALTRDVQELGRKVDQLMLRQPQDVTRQLERRFEGWVTQLEQRANERGSCEGIERSVEELKRKIDYIQQLILQRVNQQTDYRLGSSNVLQGRIDRYRSTEISPGSNRGAEIVDGQRYDKWRQEHRNNVNIGIDKGDILSERDDKTNHISDDLESRTRDYKFRWEGREDTEVTQTPTTITPYWQRVRTIATAPPPPRQPSQHAYTNNNPDHLRGSQISASHTGSRHVEINLPRSNYNFRYPEIVGSTEIPRSGEEERRTHNKNDYARTRTDNENDGTRNVNMYERTHNENNNSRTHIETENYRSRYEQKYGRRNEDGYDIPTDRAIPASSYHFRYTEHFHDPTLKPDFQTPKPPVYPTARPPVYPTHKPAVYPTPKPPVYPTARPPVYPVPRPAYPTAKQPLVDYNFRFETGNKDTLPRSDFVYATQRPERQDSITPRSRGDFTFRFEDQATTETPRTAQWYSWVRQGQSGRSRSGEGQTSEERTPQHTAHHVLSDEEADFVPSAKYGQCPLYIQGLGKSEMERKSLYSVVGTWMRDAGAADERVWSVEGGNALHWNNVVEFENQQAFETLIGQKTLQLPESCTGLGPVVFNGHLYCQAYTERKQDEVWLLKIDLQSNEVVARGQLTGQDGAKLGVSGKGWAGIYLQLQLMVDETSLWALAGEMDSRRLVLFKLDPSDLKVLEMTQLARTKDTVGPTFMTCGVLYALDSHFATSLAYVYDTKLRQEKDVSNNVFSFPSTEIVNINYNPVDRNLYIWKVSKKHSGPGNKQKSSRKRMYGIAEKLSPHTTTNLYFI